MPWLRQWRLSRQRLRTSILLCHRNRETNCTKADIINHRLYLLKDIALPFVFHWTTWEIFARTNIAKACWTECAIHRNGRTCMWAESTDGWWTHRVSMAFRWRVIWHIRRYWTASKRPMWASVAERSLRWYRWVSAIRSLAGIAVSVCQ